MNCEECALRRECESEKARLSEKGMMLSCMYESDNGVPYGRKGDKDGRQ